MPIAPDAEVVRASFQAYMAQDHGAADRLIAGGVVFTSPQDDHIGKQEFLERRFPTAGRLRSQQILQLAEAGQDGVFVMYDCELETANGTATPSSSPSGPASSPRLRCFSGAGSHSADRAARRHRSCSRHR